MSYEFDHITSLNRFTCIDETITYVMIFNNYLDYSGIILKLHISTKISYDKSNWILRRKISIIRCGFFLSPKSNIICNFSRQNTNSPRENPEFFHSQISIKISLIC